jgi:hypothetical protein
VRAHVFTKDKKKRSARESINKENAELVGKMPTRKNKSQVAKKAADLGHLRTKVAKAELQELLGEDYEVLSKGYPDITAFNMKTGTFYFVELKRESEIGKHLRPEQEKMKKILDRISGKKKYEVWYFSDKPEEKNKILVRCFYSGNKIVPIYPEKLNEELKKKFAC